MQLKILIATTIALSLILGSDGGDLPADVTKCKASDYECIRKKIMEIFDKYPNGNPDFGMPNLSALSLENVTISRATGSSPIQLNFKFNRFVSKGVEKSIVTRVSGLDKDLKYVEVDAIIPRLRISGEYETDGKILFLSLNGFGKGNVELTDAKTKVRVKCHLEQRDGKNYVKIDNIKAIIEPKKVVMQLDNIVGGNKELSDVINGVMNENWSDIWHEMKDGINNAFGQIVKNLIANIIASFSYDDFYLK